MISSKKRHLCRHYRLMGIILISLLVGCASSQSRVVSDDIRYRSNDGPYELTTPIIISTQPLVIEITIRSKPAFKAVLPNSSKIKALISGQTQQDQGFLHNVSYQIVTSSDHMMKMRITVPAPLTAMTRFNIAFKLNRSVLHETVIIDMLTI